MPTLWLNPVGPHTIRWSVSALSSPWNNSNYLRIVLSTGTVADGSLTAPSGVRDTVYPPTSGTGTQTPSRDISASPDTLYTFHAYALAMNNRWYHAGTTTTRTPSLPPPATPTITNAFATSPNTVYMSWDNVSGATIYQTLVVGQDNYTTTTSTSTYFNNLVAGQTYTFGLVAGNANGWSGWVYRTITMPVSRPLNWAWQFAKTSGGDFNITATEWTNFFIRVNAFRQYKGLSNYSYTTPSSGQLFTPTFFNQARTAISAMSPPTSVPSIATSGNIVYASDINRLRDSLNSIT